MCAWEERARERERMEAFPSVFCLKSENNNQYLRYKNEDCQTHGVLQFSAQHALDAYAQFQVEKAKCDDGLIHLKCRWNDKYWVRYVPPNLNF